MRLLQCVQGAAQHQHPQLPLGRATRRTAHRSHHYHPWKTGNCGHDLRPRTHRGGCRYDFCNNKAASMVGKMASANDRAEKACRGTRPCKACSSNNSMLKIRNIMTHGAGVTTELLGMVLAPGEALLIDVYCTLIALSHHNLHAASQVGLTILLTTKPSLRPNAEGLLCHLRLGYSRGCVPDAIVGNEMLTSHSKHCLPL